MVFLLEEEGTVVEVAIRLRNPLLEFERDPLKALIAKDRGRHVRRGVFLSRTAARKRVDQPGARAIADWVKPGHGIDREVIDLE